MFRLLVDRVMDYAIFGLDERGIVVSWNAGAQRIKGYRAEEIIGHHFSRFYTEDAIRSGWPMTELAGARKDGRFEDEGWRVRKDGSRFWANVVITALYDDAGTLRGFAKVTRDLTERKRAERLESDARQLHEFVAMLAHELRNPLAPIHNALTLAQRVEDPERLRWALDVIGRQATHLSRIVDDLLDVSRITRGQVRLDHRRVSMCSVIRDAVDAVRGTCEQMQHTLTVAADRDVLVRGDEVRLTQVLTNLLNNACKYTPQGGRIDLALSTNDGKASVSVRDTGVGIDPLLLPRIFDVFTQDDRTLDRSRGGLGLGLTIARKLAEMHGGTLTAHSSGPGCGSEFVLTVPVMETAGDPASRQVTVLVVDDNVDAAQTLHALLEFSGHRSVLAFDGEQAVQLARQELPDVILLDIGLPRMNGYEVARAIRNMPELKGVMLVAVTGYGAESDRQRAMEAGFDQHMPKPLDYALLQQRVPILASA
jgi:PAS domain S-box-containing protein